MAETTRVIHYRDRDAYDPDELVYIGRAMPRLGLRGSQFANPFSIGPEQDRQRVIERYGDYLAGMLAADHSLAESIADLHSRVLVCWCAPPGGLGSVGDPLICHGQLLARLADQWAEQRRQAALEAPEPIAPGDYRYYSERTS